MNDRQDRRLWYVLGVAVTIVVLAGAGLTRLSCAPHNEAPAAGLETQSAPATTEGIELDRSAAPSERSRLASDEEVPPAAKQVRRTVSVVDDLDQPIDMASVVWDSRSNAPPVEFRRTEMAGSYQTDEPCRLPAMLRVACESYVPVEQWLRKDPEGTMVVRLRPAGSIHGTVRTRAGRVPVEGARVLAWAASLSSPPLDLVQRAERGGDQRVAIATSTVDGTFELQGLVPEFKYNIVCAGSGYASYGVREAAPIDNTHVYLDVGYLYGAQFLLTCGDPERQRLIDQLAASAAKPIQPKLDGASYVFQPSFIPVLAGAIRGVDIERTGDGVYLFIADSDVDALGPLRYSMNLNGFKPVSESVMFPRVRGELSVRSIRVDPDPDTIYGRCKVDLVWSPALLGIDLAMNFSPGRVKFTPVGAGDGAKRISLRTGSAVASEITADVPCGEYTVAYENRSASILFPDPADAQIPVRVTPAGVTARIDLSRMGACEVNLERPNGMSVSGALALNLFHARVAGDGDTAIRTYVFFAEAPYVIGPLNPGQYTISWAGHSSEHLPTTPSYFVVEAGQVANLTVPLN